ncbi:hypothetical protein [Mesorhizobium sp.]|nr:hypothetical protein [Mesorhizobium sp.]
MAAYVIFQDLTAGAIQIAFYLCRIARLLATRPGASVTEPLEQRS